MKLLYSILIFLCISVHSFSQYPPYRVSVYTPGSSGYYFASPLSSVRTVNTQMILDSVGNLIYYKPFPGASSFDFKLQRNGMISYCLDNQFFLLDSTFTIIDSVACKNGVYTDFHEMQILPNGHYLMMGEEFVTMDLSSYNYFKMDGTAGSSAASVLCLVVQELDENKDVVFEWHAKDHFSFDSVDEYWLNDSANVDWTHSNALEMDDDGNILISSRHFNEITKINRSDSSVMWRFGGKYNEFTFIGDTVPFYGQHDIRRIANGNITLYDNGNHVVSHGARALEYELDEVNKTAEMKWGYVYDSAMFSYATGSVGRLANSNTIINWGVNQNFRNVHFSVVDPANETVFELAFEDTLFGYRSFNYLELPWGFQRPEVSCFESSGVVYLDAGDGYSSYQWNNGSTSQTVAVTGLDTFFVFVPYGEGFISSEKIIVTDVSNLCTIVKAPETASGNGIYLFPNPVFNEITIADIQNKEALSNIIITDLGGRVVSAFTPNPASGKNSLSLNVSNLEAGIYFLTVNNRTFKFIKTS